MADITEMISDVVTTVTDKAREYGEVARLHALIKAEEAKKQEYYYKLGRKYYEFYKDAPASDLAEYMAKLLAADEKIADYKEDLKVASSSEAEETEDTEETEEAAEAAEAESSEETESGEDHS